MHNFHLEIDYAAMAPALVMRFMRFAAVGTLGLGVDAGLFTALTGNGLGDFGARALSLAAAPVSPGGRTGICPVSAAVAASSSATEMTATCRTVDVRRAPARIRRTSAPGYRWVP